MYPKSNACCYGSAHKILWVIKYLTFTKRCCLTYACNQSALDCNHYWLSLQSSSNFVLLCAAVPLPSHRLYIPTLKRLLQRYFFWPDTVQSESHFMSVFLKWELQNIEYSRTEIHSIKLYKSFLMLNLKNFQIC